MRDPVWVDLGHRPDPTVLSEVPGGETWDLLQSLGAGHDESFCTRLASLAYNALERCASCVPQSGVSLPLAPGPGGGCRPHKGVSGMRPIDTIVAVPGGGSAVLRWVTSPAEVGRYLDAGVIVETELETARACGAWFDDPDDAEEAFEAAEDPAVFGAAEGANRAPS